MTGFNPQQGMADLLSELVSLREEVVPLRDAAEKLRCIEAYLTDDLVPESFVSAVESVIWTTDPGTTRSEPVREDAETIRMLQAFLQDTERFTMSATLDVLLADRDRLAGEVEIHQQNAETQAQQFYAIRDRAETYRAALEPFVAASSEIDVWPQEDGYEFTLNVTGIDIRRARRALSDSKEEGNG